jgi:hypothetical protein
MTGNLGNPGNKPERQRKLREVIGYAGKGPGTPGKEPGTQGKLKKYY